MMTSALKLIPKRCASCWSFSFNSTGRRIVVCSTNFLPKFLPPPLYASYSLHPSLAVVSCRFFRIASTILHAILYLQAVAAAEYERKEAYLCGYADAIQKIMKMTHSVLSVAFQNRLHQPTTVVTLTAKHTM